jgi:hypothetical protein
MINIVGNAANRIKNNVSGDEPQRFSWRLTFPKSVIVEAIPAEDIVILNKNLQRVRTEFVVDGKSNSIFISPRTPYKEGQEYYFWVKHWAKQSGKWIRKEICIAFVVTEEDELRTFDQQTSMAMLGELFKKQERRAAARKKAEQGEEGEGEEGATPAPKPAAQKGPDVIDDDDEE